MTPSCSAQWTEAFLDSMRQVGDPPADSAVAVLLRNREVDAVHLLMRTLTENEDPPPEALPGVVREFVERADGLPSWADTAKIQAGRAVFERNRAAILAVLMCGALPLQYASKKGVQALQRIEKLYSNPRRRCAEAAHLLVSLFSQGTVSTARRQRLIHAAGRALLLHSGKWDKDWDQPLNQEDLAGWQVGLSHGIPAGLAKLGVELSPAEVDSFQHAVHAAAPALGIQADLVPRSAEDAAILAGHFQRRQFATCSEGREMTRELAESLDYILPGDRFDGAAAELMRYLLGDEHAEMVGLGPKLWKKLISAPSRWLGGGEEHGPRDAARFGSLAADFGQALRVGLAHVERGGNLPAFSG